MKATDWVKSKKILLHFFSKLLAVTDPPLAWIWSFEGFEARA